jgi:hypothetical protein
MLSARLVKMIENHAEELARSVVGDLQGNPKTPAYSKLPAEALHRRVHEVFREFGQWLEYKPDETMKRWYGEMGRKRYIAEIGLPEVIHALLLTKYHLQDYIRSAGLVDSAMELYQELELQRLVNRFSTRRSTIVSKVTRRRHQYVSKRPGPRGRAPLALGTDEIRFGLGLGPG